MNDLFEVCFLFFYPSYTAFGIASSDIFAWLKIKLEGSQQNPTKAIKKLPILSTDIIGEEAIAILISCDLLTSISATSTKLFMKSMKSDLSSFEPKYCLYSFLIIMLQMCNEHKPLLDIGVCLSKYIALIHSDVSDIYLFSLYTLIEAYISFTNSYEEIYRLLINQLSTLHPLSNNFVGLNILMKTVFRVQWHQLGSKMTRS